jgi:hypothetical protein
MAKNKTTETQFSVSDFIASIKDEKKRSDCSVLVKLISKHTTLIPKMWGTSIVEFGSYHYTYESGREGDAPLVGLSPRANAITLYLSNIKDKEDLLKKLGKHKIGGGCVYVSKLEYINTEILTKLIDHSINYLQSKYPG